MMPSAKIVNANRPATGLRASAAWLDVWMSTVPATRAADPGANFLDRGHQRIAEEHRPGDGKSELGSSLRIRRYPARIIICRSGNQSGAKHIQQARL